MKWFDVGTKNYAGFTVQSAFSFSVFCHSGRTKFIIVYLITLSLSEISCYQIIGGIVTSEFVQLCGKYVAAYFDILSRLLPVGTEKNNEWRILSDKVDDIRGEIWNWGFPITKPTC